jgi:hypothetical protein
MAWARECGVYSNSAFQNERFSVAIVTPLSPKGTSSGRSAGASLATWTEQARRLRYPHFEMDSKFSAPMLLGADNEFEMPGRTF